MSAIKIPAPDGWQSIQTAPVGRLLMLAKIVDGKVIEQESGSLHHNGACYWGGRLIKYSDEAPTHWRHPSYQGNRSI